MTHKELISDIIDPKLTDGCILGTKMKGVHNFSMPNSTTQRKCVEQRDAGIQREMLKQLSNDDAGMKGLIRLGESKTKAIKKQPID